MVHSGGLVPLLENDFLLVYVSYPPQEIICIPLKNQMTYGSLMKFRATRAIGQDHKAQPVMN